MAIEERFDQPSFKTYMKLEGLLLHAARGESYIDGMNELKDLYSDEIDISSLETEFFLRKC